MNPLKNPLLLCFTGLLLGGCNTLAELAAPAPTVIAEDIRAGQYTLDPAHAALTFRIDHLGFSNYVGRFEQIEATLDFDATAPETARLEARIDMTSLNVANPDFAETLIGPAWFDSETHPQAMFTSSGIEVTSENTGRVSGDLIWRGAAHPMTLDVQFNGGDNDLFRGAYIVGFSATGTFNRSDYGVTRLVGPIGDAVEITIEAEFIKTGD